MLWTLCAPGGFAQSSPPVLDEVDQDIQRLISGLSSDDFHDREDSEQKLLEIGVDAIPRLERFRHVGDSELRLRVVRIIGLLQRDHLNLTIRRFLSGESTLPGWETFAGVVGDNGINREIYVEIYRTRHPVLSEFDQSVHRISTLKSLLSELEDLRSRQTGGDSNLMACVSMYIIKVCSVSIDGSNLSSKFRSRVHQYFGRSSMNQLIVTKDGYKEDPFQPLHRAAAVAWITLDNPDELAQRIEIARRLSLPEGLEPATRCLAQEEPMSSHTLRYSMVMVALHGDKTHVPLLARYLDDNIQLHRSSAINEKQQLVPYTTRLGDLALATMIYLSGENYRDYGLNLTGPRNLGTPLPIERSGFYSEEIRQQSRADWRNFLKTQKD